MRQHKKVFPLFFLLTILISIIVFIMPVFGVSSSSFSVSPTFSYTTFSFTNKNIWLTNGSYYTVVLVARTSGLSAGNLIRVGEAGNGGGFNGMMWAYINGGWYYGDQRDCVFAVYGVGGVVVANYTPTVTNYDEIGTQHLSNNTYNSAYGQSFRVISSVSSGMYLDYVTFSICKVGAPTADIVAYVYGVSAFNGVPSGDPLVISFYVGESGVIGEYDTWYSNIVVTYMVLFIFIIVPPLIIAFEFAKHDVDSFMGFIGGLCLTVPIAYMVHIIELWVLFVFVLGLILMILAKLGAFSRF